MELQQFRVIVRRLRIRATPADVLRLQRRVAELAAGADLHGSFLSPAAILCIRRLDDPRPRTLRLADRRLRPAQEWEAAARSRISDLAARAARPALGPVPASAEAVLFLDRAELVACLARDWSESLVASCWWWRALFGTMDDVAHVVRAWRERPEHVPAACHLLATWRRLAPFIKRLPPAGVISLIRDVACTFGIDAVGRALATRSAAAPSARQTDDSETLGEVPREIAVAAEVAQGQAALARYVPELADLELTPEQRVLAVVSLVLHRSPSDARRILSANIVESLLAETAPTPSIVDTLPPPKPAEERSRATANGPARTPDDAMTNAGVVLPERVASVPTELQTIDRSPDAPVPQSGSAVRDVDALELPAQPEPTPPPARRPAEEIAETEFGGAFYLINVAIDLGLYGDFTMPRAPGIDLPIWDFLVLVTERLIDDERLQNDPLVPFLTRLADRDPSEPAGASFVPSGTETLEAWLNALAARILARLSGALGVAQEAAADLVIRRPARVSLSPSHLDVAFALDDLPIEIRLAGLDRDPGFVPAAGLTVTFSYV